MRTNGIPEVMVRAVMSLYEDKSQSWTRVVQGV